MAAAGEEKEVGVVLCFYGKTFFLCFKRREQSYNRPNKVGVDTSWWALRACSSARAFFVGAVLGVRFGAKYRGLRWMVIFCWIGLKVKAGLTKV